MSTVLEAPMPAAVPGGLPFAPVPDQDLGPNLADRAVIARVLSGDKEAFSILVNRYDQRVFRVCMSVTKEHEAAEDCIQKSFILALDRLTQFRAEAQFSTWLTRIAFNVALTHRRKLAKRAFLVSIESDGDLPVQLIDQREGPEVAYSRLELRKLLERVMNSLSPVLRAVLILRDVEELSIAETSRILSISEAAVKTRLLRARLKMRDRLAPWFARQAFGYRPVVRH